MAAPIATVTVDYDSDLVTIAELKKTHPGNRMAKHFDSDYFNSLAEEEKRALLQCCRSGIVNASSEMGVYAMQPTDYDRFKLFFSKVYIQYNICIQNHLGVSTTSKMFVGKARGGDGELCTQKLHGSTDVVAACTYQKNRSRIMKEQVHMKIHEKKMNHAKRFVMLKPPNH